MTLDLFVDDPARILSTWPTTPLTSHHGRWHERPPLTIADIRATVDARCIRPDEIVLIRDGEITPQASYVEEGRIIPSAIWEHHDAGDTISLRNIQSVFPAVSALHAGLHAEIGHPMHVSAYLTPPNARGLSHHWDSYPVLVAQVEGAKTWPLHRPVVENPTPEHLSFPKTGFTDEQRQHVRTTPADVETTLHPGDALWVPRGWIHAPFPVGDGPSLHLTFAVRELTYFGLAQRLVQQALTDPRMRRALPVGLPAEWLSTELSTASELFSTMFDHS
ncbi:JmjC domain-containing protein [Streptomyces sp. FH025]|uniref:JmjC domain-containing protein n=1 Tax=Streptomyces sp. FH025 TaxID=2815937 RepID=UPI001A9D8EC4|nr:cupin domain-containing protein [Streptomyces sp. FH025]MBO1417821.1 cupin [Streptomyces sp. FH025]